VKIEYIKREPGMSGCAVLSSGSGAMGKKERRIKVNNKRIAGGLIVSGEL
jgi:hypothetical protein